MTLTISQTPALIQPVATPAKIASEVIFYASKDCALGHVLAARSVNGVCAILIGTDLAGLRGDLAARFPSAALVLNEAALRDDLAKVVRFMESPAEGLELTLDMRGTPFQRRVWEKLRAIPAGRTMTYAEVARWVSPRTSARAIGSACAANPIALAIPCHRVVRSDGDLAGYRWGLERKRELIKKEATAKKGVLA